MEHEKAHITPYWVYVAVLAVLIAFTLISVYVTSIDFKFGVAIALGLAAIKSFFVLTWFMHLKFDKPVFRILFIIVLLVFVAVLFVLFSDYSYR